MCLSGVVVGGLSKKKGLCETKPTGRYVNVGVHYK